MVGLLLLVLSAPPPPPPRRGLAMRDPVPLKLKPKPLDSFEEARPRLELALAASRRSRTFSSWASNLGRLKKRKLVVVIHGMLEWRQIVNRNYTDEFPLLAFLDCREATPPER